MNKKYRINGMNCNSCAHLIESELKDKVNKISVSYKDEKAEIDFDENKISEKEIKEIIEELGYEAEAEQEKKEEKEVEEEETETEKETEEIKDKKIREIEKRIEESKRELDEIKNRKAKVEAVRERFERDRRKLERLEEQEEEEKKEDKDEEEPEEEIITETKKEGVVDKVGFYFMIASIILLIAVLYFFVFRNMKLPEFKIPEIGEKTSLFLLFAAGILTGFHCVSMCGGFVISYTAKNALNGHKGFRQHLVYGGSKVISYTIIGGIFGLIGGIIAFSAGLRGAVAIFAGIFMIFYALSMFGLKFFRRFQFNPKFLTKVASSGAGKYKGPYSRPLVTGLLNGLFIACGPLQALYLYATGTGSFISGATSLAAFGLGTLPVMLGFGSLASVISHKTTKKILKLSAVIVLILGLIMLNRGLVLTGSSYTFDSVKEKIISSTSAVGVTDNVKIENGVQIVNMDVDASGYSPNSFVIKKGVPVKWNINVKQLTGCNSELIMNEYNIDARLKQGMNIFEFTPEKTGTTRFSCGMGMIRGSFIVTETGTASQEEVKAATPQSGGSCSMGGGGGGCGCGG